MEIDLLRLMLIADQHPSVSARVGTLHAVGFAYCAPCAVDRVGDMQSGGMSPVIRLASVVFIDTCHRCGREIVPNLQVFHGD